jgi:hypothetical protein
MTMSIITYLVAFALGMPVPKLVMLLLGKAKAKVKEEVQKL